MQKEITTFLSHNQKTPIHLYTYQVATPPKGILQITHGMAEHLERYEPFITHLVQAGFAVIGHDHAGHGQSLFEGDPLGFVAEEEGHKTLIHDALTVTKKGREMFPQVPFFLLGHSMGSMVALSMLREASHLYKAVVLTGVATYNPLAPFGLQVARLLSIGKNKRKPSTFLDKLSFGSNNKKYQNPKTKFDWLSRDEREVTKYIKDPLCGYVFTGGGFTSLYGLMIDSQHQRDSLSYQNKNLPIYLLAGTMDPINRYGKDIPRLQKKLTAKGQRNVQTKLYEDHRHELLFEECNDIIMKDITMLLEMHLS